MARDNAAVLKKARIDQLEEIIRDLQKEELAAEQSFIKDRGLGVSDLVYIDDEKELYRLMEEFVALPEVFLIQSKISAAKAEKKALEDEIIEKALALIPPKEAADLRKGINRVIFREKIINTYMKYATKGV